MTPLALNDYRVLHSLTDPTLQCINLMPQIPQGDGQGNRTGNTVMTKKAYLYVSIAAIQQSATPTIGPIYMDMFIFKAKGVICLFSILREITPLQIERM